MITHKHSLSITLSQINAQFLEEMARKLKISKSGLIDKILYIYKKQMIQKEFSADAASDTDEDISFVEADFQDFINMKNI